MQAFKLNGLSSWKKCYIAWRYESLSGEEETLRSQKGKESEVTLEREKKDLRKLGESIKIF